jgi:hypothetical protein
VPGGSTQVYRKQIIHEPNPSEQRSVPPTIVLHIFVCPCFGNHHGWFCSIRALSQHISGAIMACNWMQTWVAERVVAVTLLIRYCRICMSNEIDNENNSICNPVMRTAGYDSSVELTEPNTRIHSALQSSQKVTEMPVRLFLLNAVYSSR